MPWVSAVRLATMVVTASMVLAQARPDISKPDSAREKLNYFAGTWTVEVHMATSPFGSRVFFATEHNEWMPGSSLLVSRQQGDAALGSGGLAVMAYNPSEKAYKCHVVNGTGDTEDLKGHIEGSTWTWTSEATANGRTTVKARLIVTELSPVSYSLKFEAASEERNWSTIMEGKATKVIPHAHQDVAFLR